MQALNDTDLKNCTNSDAKWPGKKRASFFWLVEFKGNPSKKKKKQGHHWATGLKRPPFGSASLYKAPKDA